MTRLPGVALGLLLGTAVDAVLGDPVRGHPVAAFGTAAARAEERLWADSRPRGAAFAAATVGPVVAASAGAQRWLRGDGALAVTAAATWTVLGGASLAAEAVRSAEWLEAGDLAAARVRLPALCGRDPEGLDAAGIARAVVESVAENTCDAVVAPLAWGAACGLPGLLGHRAANTLDAMVGHHSPRYERFGWAAARLDDLAAFVPARLTALLALALAPAVGGSAARPAGVAPRRRQASKPQRGPLRGRVRWRARGSARRCQRLRRPGGEPRPPRRRPAAGPARHPPRGDAVPPRHRRGGVARGARGFVGAVESKAALRASGLPSVTNRSEKGGAAVAAAALNALLYAVAPGEPGGRVRPVGNSPHSEEVSRS